MSELKASELRIGNYVFGVSDRIEIVCSITDEELKTKTIHFDDHFTSEIKYFNPIPLTEEWLIKFGFVKADNNRFEHELLVWDVEQHGDKFAFCIWDEENPAVTNFIMHSYFVHTFQNNFFALTGKELTHQKIN